MDFNCKGSPREIHPWVTQALESVERMGPLKEVHGLATRIPLESEVKCEMLSHFFVTP